MQPKVGCGAAATDGGLDIAGHTPAIEREAIGMADAGADGVISGIDAGSAALAAPAGSDSECLDEVVEELVPSTRIEICAPGIVITIRGTEPTPPSTGEAASTNMRLRKARVNNVTTVAVHERQLYVRMSGAAYTKLRETVGSLPPERGGVFVGPDPFCIEDFIFDKGSDPARAVYYPDVSYLNGILERSHEPFGRRFVGLAHSHPAGFWRPSGDADWGDIKAARNNLRAASNADLCGLFIPIIESAATAGNFIVHAFVMLRKDFRVHTARCEVVDLGKRGTRCRV